MEKKSFRHYLDLTTNIVVLLFAICLVSVFAWKWLYPPKGKIQNPFLKGSLFSEISELNETKYPKTLILALNTNCSFCIQSLPFYKNLIDLNKQKNNPIQIVALFPQSKEEVATFLEKNNLNIKTISNIDYGILKIPVTPTNILIDSNREIIQSWLGKQSSEKENEISELLFENLTNSSNISRVDKSNKILKIFDENQSNLTVVADSQEYGNKPSFVSYVCSDKEENIFFTAYDSIYKYSSEGKFLKKVKFPPESLGNFYLSLLGNIYFPSVKGIDQYSSDLDFVQNIEIDQIKNNKSQILKIVSDNDDENIFIQTYSQLPISQRLYKFNLKTKNATEIFALKNPVKFTPTYNFGAFDFVISNNNLFISDIFDYKVLVCDLNGSLIKTINKEFATKEISEEDGKLILRNMTIGGINSSDSLKKIPPILHLNITNNGSLLVWTSERDEKLRQLIHIYDKDLNFVGIDYQYTHPELNTYNFRNGKIYVPDYGFGKEINTASISPMEIPNRHYSIKVFTESF